MLTFSRAEHRRARGFTLLELLTALAILSFSALAIGALARTPSDDAIAADAAREIAQALTRGKSKAALRGEDIDIAIDVASGEYWIAGSDQKSALPEQIKISAQVAREVSDDADIAVVRFLPDGSSTGAEFVLSIGAAERRVSAHWLTGVIRVE